MPCFSCTSFNSSVCPEKEVPNCGKLKYIAIPLQKFCSFCIWTLQDLACMLSLSICCRLEWPWREKRLAFVSKTCSWIFITILKGQTHVELPCTQADVMFNIIQFGITELFKVLGYTNITFVLHFQTQQQSSNHMSSLDLSCQRLWSCWYWSAQQSFAGGNGEMHIRALRG